MWLIRGRQSANDEWHMITAEPRTVEADEAIAKWRAHFQYVEVYRLIPLETYNKGEGAYPEMCRDPKICEGKGYCPRDPACND